MVPDNFEINEELWAIYAWWTAVLILKMMYLSWTTGRLRVKHKIFHSEEDKMWVEGPVTLNCTGGGHPAVDKIRELHQRDLKILIPYTLFVPLWLSILPCNYLTKIAMRIVPLANILYTLASLNTIPNLRFYICTILSSIEYCTLTIILISFFVNCLESA